MKSSPPEPKRQPPPLPPKPSPRNSGMAEAAVAVSLASKASEPNDPRVTAVVTSHVPLGKRASVMLPNSLEKTIELKKGNAGLGEVL